MSIPIMVCSYCKQPGNMHKSWKQQPKESNKQEQYQITLPTFPRVWQHPTRVIVAYPITIIYSIVFLVGYAYLSHQFDMEKSAAAQRWHCVMHWIHSICIWAAMYFLMITLLLLINTFDVRQQALAEGFTPKCIYLQIQTNFVDQSLHAIFCREKQSSFTRCANIDKTTYLTNLTHIFFMFGTIVIVYIILRLI